ncbi:hypothetical protein BDN72DRAFT_551718 [Pluteus cervinus]|uniref:Uncharacterized protein n=1 Tax=Pluteus cervinus TaxID=181527 RepID=A0ACD3AWZ6_9AGAR|nr:hypothetical protein BDN72DRAFT_551718 [Pluteus cervinus]
MVSFKILAGGYTSFVATYLFNTDTNSLSVYSRSTTGTNPSWISAHPKNSSILYAVNEVGPTGALQSFTISQSGTLSSAVETITSSGSNPAYVVPLSSGEVAIMNYSSGNGRIIPTTSSPQRFNSSAGVLSFAQTGRDASHPHMALEYNGEILVPDLGGDTIWRLVQNGSPGQFRIQGSIPQPYGSGPRHIAIYNERLFTIHELSSTLSVQTIPAAPNGTSTVISTVSIIPTDAGTPPSGSTTWAAAEILIPSPSSRFPTPYIYVSNRNVGYNLDPRGDSIAIFEHVNVGTSSESLRLVNQVFTGLSQIRGMQFGPADSRGGDEFLIAAGVAGTAGTVVLRRTEGGRNLQVVARNLDIPTRTSFVWL